MTETRDLLTRSEADTVFGSVSTRLEHLRALVVELLKRLDTLEHTSAVRGSAVDEIRREFLHMAETVDELYKIVVAGNGQKPLMARIEGIEARITSLREHGKRGDDSGHSGNTLANFFDHERGREVERFRIRSDFFRSILAPAIPGLLALLFVLAGNCSGFKFPPPSSNPPAQSSSGVTP